MIDKLEMFIALARTKHFGKAAEVCGVTQPTLSAAIRQLESQLGVMLVRRGSRFIGLTAEGERVLDWARRISGDAQAMRAELRSFSGRLHGHLRIGVIPTALSMVAELTAAFSAKHSEVRFTILSRTTEDIISLVEDVSLDAGITYLDQELTSHLTAAPLYEERYRLVIAHDMAGLDKTEIRWAELASLPLCLLTPDMQNRRIIDAHLSQAGIDAQPLLESDSVISLISHVRSGKFASVMPVKLIEAFGLAGGLRTIPVVDPDAAHLVGLVTAQRTPQSPLVDALFEVARRYRAGTQ